MKCLIYCSLLFISFSSIKVCGQTNNNKKDTLFYLLDTSKIPAKDRIIEIFPYPKTHSFYTYFIRTACMIYQSDPNLMSVRNDAGQILNEKELKKITFIDIVTLNRLLCKETEHFTKNHQLYFIEHLPDGKYLKRQIILGALESGVNDHVLKD